MSIIRNITPVTTGRTFDDITSKLKAIKGCIITLSTQTFTRTEIDNYLTMAAKVGTISIFSLHNGKNFTPEDDQPVYNKSKQEFTYKTKPKKYRHSLLYDYAFEFQQLVDSFSGSNLYIIYYDNDWNIILTSDNNGTTFRGFKTSMLNFEEPNFPTLSESMVKRLVVELKDSTEFSERGKTFRLPYPPELIDRIVAKLEAYVYLDHAIIHLSYRDEDIDTILSSEISIVDDVQGEISFTLFSYLGGVYSISGFNKTPGSGCLTITNSLYIARIRYVVIPDSIITDYVLFENGDACLSEEGDFILFEN